MKDSHVILIGADKSFVCYLMEPPSCDISRPVTAQSALTKQIMMEHIDLNLFHHAIRSMITHCLEIALLSHFSHSLSIPANQINPCAWALSNDDTHPNP